MGTILSNGRLYYCAHEFGGEGRKRVWVEGWSGDQFEVLTPEDFAKLGEFAQRFGFQLVEWEPE